MCTNVCDRFFHIGDPIANSNESLRDQVTEFTTLFHP